MFRTLSAWPFYLASVCIAYGSGIVHAASWDQVSARQDRCAMRLEQIGYRHRRLTERIESTAGASAALSERKREQALESVDRAREQTARIGKRLDRAVRLAERNRRDIQQKRSSSEGCPDCIVSSIDLFCRQVDDIGSKLDEAETALARMNAKLDIPALSAPGAPSDSLDSLFDQARDLLDAAPDSTAASLIEKAAQHHARAKALAARHNLDDSRTERRIARRFIEKAIALLSSRP